MRNPFLTPTLLIAALAAAPALLLPAPPASAGAQAYEPLAASVQASLSRAVSDKAAPRLAFGTRPDADAWLREMSRRLERRMPDPREREEFLVTVHYEATRAWPRSPAGPGRDPGGKQFQEVRCVHGRRPGLHAGDAVLGGADRRARAQPVKRHGGTLYGLAFLIELDFLNGREKLAGEQVTSILHY